MKLLWQKTFDAAKLVNDQDRTPEQIFAYALDEIEEHTIEMDRLIA